MRNSAMLLLMLWTLTPLWAQDQKGGIAGTVKDSSDYSVIPDATLSLVNKDASVTATTDKAGEYRFPTLAPGLYDLTVKAAGYREYLRSRIEVGQTATRMSITLTTAKEQPAIKELEAAVDAKPDDYEAHFRLGRAYSAPGGDVTKAHRELTKALEIRPESEAALIALARLALAVGNPREVLVYTVKLNPVNFVGRLLEASAYFRLGRFDEAAARLNALRKEEPNHVDMLVEQGVLYLVQKQYREAEEPFRRASAIDPTNPLPVSGLVEIHLQSNEPDKAVELIAHEAEAQPLNRDLQRDLASVLGRVKQYDKAIATYQLVLEKFNNNPAEQADIFSRLGDIFAAKGDYPSAVERHKKAVQLAPENSAYMIRLAGVYDRQNKETEAVATYRESLKVDPNNWVALNNLAYLLAENKGDLEEALRLAQKARQSQPAALEIQDTVGWIYLKMQMVDSAARIFEDLVARAGANSGFHYHYALALALKGDKEGALKQLDLAIVNKPGKESEQQIMEMMRKLNGQPAPASGAKKP